MLSEKQVMKGQILCHSTYEVTKTVYCIKIERMGEARGWGKRNGNLLFNVNRVGEKKKVRG